MFPIKRPLSLQSRKSLRAATSIKALAFNVALYQSPYKPLAIHQHRNTFPSTSSISGLTAPAPSRLQRANELYLLKKVPNLFSLPDCVIVITGGARGIGLALAFAVADVGGKIAIVDAAAEPHEHYRKFKEVASRVDYYKFAFLFVNISSKRCRRLDSDYHRSDVTDYSVLRQTFDDIARHFRTIHGW